MLKFCLGYNETKLLCDKITMRQNSSKAFTSKAKKLRCKKFHNHQECRDESEIYNYHRAQLSNNKFINGIFGFTLHDLAWLQSLSFYDTGFTKNSKKQSNALKKKQKIYFSQFHKSTVSHLKVFAFRLHCSCSLLTESLLRWMPKHYTINDRHQ